MAASLRHGSDVSAGFAWPNPRDRWRNHRQIVVRSRAVAVKAVDAIPGAVRRRAFRRLRYPTVLGSDLAGVVETGRHPV